MAVRIPHDDFEHYSCCRNSIHAYLLAHNMSCCVDVFQHLGKEYGLHHQVTIKDSYHEIRPHMTGLELPSLNN